VSPAEVIVAALEECANLSGRIGAAKDNLGMDAMDYRASADDFLRGQIRSGHSRQREILLPACFFVPPRWC
jgi:hypothetical protein